VPCIWQQAWTITRIDLSTNHQLQRRYVQLNIVAWMARTIIILDLTGISFDTAKSGGFRLHFAANMEYNTHWIVDEPLIAGEVRSFEYWWLCIKKCNFIGFDRDQSWHSETGYCGLYLASNVDYNAHWIVDISQISTVIRSIQYCSLNSKKCNYILFDRDHGWHGVNKRIRTVFGSKCG
jgi:hypothetical protein